MATSHDWADTLTFVAPAGAATAGTIIRNATTLAVILPMTTAASGSNYIGKIAGRVNGVTRLTATDWIVGMPLSHDGTAFSTVKTGVAIIAHAANAATATTGDVILCPPSAVTP